jgi:hypothetical protein
MKIKSLATFLTLIPSIRPTLITQKKLCKDCKFFIANNNECAKFGSTDLVTGKNTYDYASSARNYDKKCGEDAKYFEENTMKIITVPYYHILKYWYWYPTVFIYILWIYVIAHEK